MIARVTSIEHDLLVVARALFDPRQHAVVAPLVRTARPLQKIGRTSMGVLQDTLAKGTVRRIARSGAFDRAWESAQPALKFSAASFEILRWLLTSPLGTSFSQLRVNGKITLADELLMVAVHDLARNAGVGDAVLVQPPFASSALVALHAVDDYARVHSSEPPKLRVDAERLALVTALGTDLGSRWRRIERDKAAVTDPARLTAIGRAQTAVLEPLLSPVQPFALRFLLESATFATARLEPTTTLGARVEARRMAVAPLRAIMSVAALRERLRLVGFVDDDYDEAQRVLRFLEPWHDLFARAEGAVNAADALEEPS